jgi:hypothetical protein
MTPPARHPTPPVIPVAAKRPRRVRQASRPSPHRTEGDHAVQPHSDSADVAMEHDFDNEETDSAMARQAAKGRSKSTNRDGSTGT